MTRLRGHAVNAGLAPEVAPLPGVAGADLEAAVANVAAWGGVVGLYRRAVLAGLAAAGAAADREPVRSVGVLAAWRSGVLDLRADARVRLAALVDDGRANLAGAVLGLPPDAVTVFAARQERQPLAWPLLAAGDPVVRVGGFRGLGGTWSTPPRSLTRAPDGALVVRCADGGAWRLEVDVFGHRLTPLDPPPDAAGPGVGVPGASVDPRSYLLTLTGELG